MVIEYRHYIIAKTHDAVDGNGTPTTETILYTYDARNRLTAEGPDIDADGMPDTGTATTYGYDSNGSTKSVTSGAATKKYVWDLRNRMAGYDANGDGDTADTAGCHALTRCLRKSMLLQETAGAWHPTP